MKKFNWLLLVFLLLFIKPITGQAAEAPEGKTVQITLHKLLFPNGELPNSQANNGQEKDMLQTYRGLNGVTFQVYDVTDSFYRLREKGKPVEEVQKEIAQTGSKAGTLITEKTTGTVNGEDGIVSFQLTEKDDMARDKAYLFIETKTPEIVKEKADNMVVALPVYGQNQQQLTSIHLYPKNEENDYPEPSFEKKLDEPRNDFSIGETIDYSLHTRIPVNILDYQRFNLSDQADEALDFLPESLKISVDGQTLSEGIEIYNKAHGFSVHFAPSSLEPFAGKELKISYQMRLNQAAKPNTEIINEGIFDFGSELQTKKIPVLTGHKQFVKVDSKEPNKHLPGAIFLIKNDAGDYLQQSTDGYQWTKNKTHAHEWISGKNGEFSVSGLKTGHYQLEEIKAPAGYILSQKEIPFTISATFSQKREAAEALKVINKKEDTSFLPKTNDTNSLLLILAGLFIVGSVWWIYIKKRGVNK
ncbi:MULTISPECIES: SpaH/EbpB family LPXTG-anchored major pilin [unclassified Enterococcus]|uniref:SpaH/EbpB family LPXTG-anchored major pilin n=1 Tax=unclassified Enterococcus TaxID=2608891 RepID=UPI0013EAD076|nr:MULTISPECIES: SpaH/EbpB family LPXTG-anchored major pilin [unclassified Enterococcus]